jgi:hypothetical protein
VKTIKNPQGKKQNTFSSCQEACRKDTQQTFGVLQDQFAIVQGLSHFCGKKSINNIMMDCVILHHIIIEGERDLDLDFEYDNVGTNVPELIQAFPVMYWRMGD